MFCKDPKLAIADDFFFSGLDKAGNTESSPVGSNVTTVNVNQIPGLNTLGISLVRIDYGINGQNPPTCHRDLGYPKRNSFGWVCLVIPRKSSFQQNA